MAASKPCSKRQALIPKLVFKRADLRQLLLAAVAHHARWWHIHAREHALQHSQEIGGARLHFKAAAGTDVGAGGGAQACKLCPLAARLKPSNNKAYCGAGLQRVGLGSAHCSVSYSL